MYIKLVIVFLISLFHNNLAYSKTYISQVGPSLSYPWGVSKIDNENVLITEKGGNLKKINIVTGKSTTIKNVPKVLYLSQGGLLDVFVEKRNNNKYVLMCYSKPSEDLFASTTVLHKSTLMNNALTDDKIIFSTHQPLNESIHFGCRIAVSEDYIYLSLGDRGNRINSQNIKNYEGSVVRIKFNGQKITKNKFNINWLNEVFSIGHRNPQGLIINPKNNTIWSHEHGPQGGDEINLLEGGENYGWPNDEPETPVPEGTIGPVATWIPHSSVNGIDYRRANSSLPGLDPSETQVTLYATVFGSWNAIIPVGHEIIQIDLKLNETTQEWESETTSFAQDLGTPLPIAIHPESGEIYYATFGQNGQLRHIS